MSTEPESSQVQSGGSKIPAKPPEFLQHLEWFRRYWREHIPLIILALCVLILGGLLSIFNIDGLAKLIPWSDLFQSRFNNVDPGVYSRITISSGSKIASNMVIVKGNTGSVTDSRPTTVAHVIDLCALETILKDTRITEHNIGHCAQGATR